MGRGQVLSPAPLPHLQDLPRGLGKDQVHSSVSTRLTTDNCFGNLPVMKNDMTIKEGKAMLRKKFDDGVECPCCKQLVKRYKRKMNANMAAFLIHLVKLSTAKQPWVDYRSVNFRGRDYNYLAHWGLAETELSVKDDTKRTTGLWRPTEKGILFAHNKVVVPSHVYIYNNKALKFEETTVNVIEALGKKFSYQELMAA